MQLIPAIDIRGGKCVRLRQGDPNEQTIFDESPLKVGRQFVEAGATKIHIVDLDGAIENKSQNVSIIQELAEELPVKIELGGGIRSFETIEFWLDAGINQVILGTIAVEKPVVVKKAVEAFGAAHIIVGIDTKGGNAATHGWQSISERSAVEFAQKLTDAGVERFIYTAIETDGMMTGPSLKELSRFAREVPAKVTASGGIRNLDDVLSLLEYEEDGIDSVIIGRAIYEGKIDVAETVKALAGAAR
ncbi:MAG: 1-(5-phosphoribosyl)-5-[(5-phosphoribosylamino)methylideneamino]imidazole-4-carboxamide isomerase [Candidatus Marinimicrobia bacterium]|nr:1-(5-phosphoribosyl)-5-[(5-phosphoribosylamino)methylideneamino]imidazole-4-carboxamide isomerase [Candidatus Neomarinimicrobiota bacterium]MCF7827586.1 1-(5-phosphoribosyl)-5-[(5-phosphoribosylamino)methylideneamino]imidazole-4-carboxamide isomerase [Candidatus Neomarinimicrobiota bacterium]MCF7881552.1 1-(5-phosphoribosyl)-5-[(5-phosphoribosylamino)methylideneamino]imidazole-4-carboxamide isomerase [Candidatus Neomarinimicrobiota bacterium]